jgi:Pyruvate/2-oxoacid:ferredoxin oxidoreductase gamma subunit
MPWFTCEFTGMSRISFCVADDPFYKSLRAKYYPEVVLINHNSEIEAVINPFQADSGSVFEYQDDFREPTMKVNDDRKIKINLAELMKDGKAGKMILLSVKSFDLKKGKAGEFDRAWYRLVNEETN